ncbi:hypothetical protein Y032_0124g1241 [Ancylostoma ceylanicum]|uniref:Major facilitator superfamily (MFS) profile domain-containing protein n=1 Tax=Ancylostoma ceylanicum TaxID=53326 RepID=A0A016T8F5_9BILA|nr:hypothetical protein Y032_0124g1241 [Ancylostoma ceylanicum]
MNSELLRRIERGSDAGCYADRFTWCSNLSSISPWLYYPLYVLVFGCVHSLLNICVTTIFSQVMGPCRQGTSQGLFIMAGSLGRLLAPLLMTALYTRFGPRAPWTVEIVQFYILAIVWLTFYKKMVPLQSRTTFEK